MVHHDQLLKAKTCHCSHSCLLLALFLSCWYEAKTNLLEEISWQGFTQDFLMIFIPSIFPPVMTMMNLWCPISFILLVIIIRVFIIILLPLTSSNTSSFVACSIHFISIILLCSHISFASTLSLLYLPIIHASQLYNIILPMYIFIFFFFFLCSYSQMFVSKKCLYFLKTLFVTDNLLISFVALLSSIIKLPK